MKEKSILDKLGRISIPKEVREEIDFGANDIFEIEIRDGKIMLLKGNEESLKVKRPLDPTGRLVIPIEIRQALNYKEGDHMEITVERVLLISKI
ncbi:MAG: AbrB/MazE/SpoVT family DNA-binding domain-containing protein [Defluviitaleaceae bacterium]|nr:AbrB/MazE/SpoVT family DNA-binding domain-containing protein [Defluviitaleaceae bacterium]